MSSDEEALEHKQYLARKHAQMITPPEMVGQFVKQAVGSDLKDQKRLILGESNEVYDVTVENGLQVIVRISHDEDDTFDKEKWATEKCLEVNIPVPKVLYVDNNNLDGKFRSVCVMEKIKGEPLASLIKDKKISNQQLANFLRKTGQLMSAFPDIKPTNFGKIDGNGVGDKTSWENWILKRKKKVDRYKEVARKLNLGEEKIEQALTILEESRAIYQTITPHLLHGDLGYEHVFIDGENISGIIDWGNVKSGDPAHDFAWWNFFHLDDQTGVYLMEGYQNKDLFKGNFSLRLHLAKLYLSLDFLDYYEWGGSKVGLEFATDNFAKALKSLT